MSCWENPKVSVVMPAFNAEQYIEKSIRSVKAQTVSDWELIVVNDCSSDRTAEIVRALMEADPRIRLLNNERNSGVAASRNRAVQQAKGAYIAFLDSDDIWHPEKLEKQLACAEQTKADLIYTSYAIVDHTGEGHYKDFTVPARVTFDSLLKENVIGCSTVMLTGDVARAHQFEENFYHEDYVLWLNILRAGGKPAGIEQVLVDYTFHEDSKAGNKRNSAKKRWNIYRGYLGFSVVKSGWYFAHYALAGLRKYKKK